MVAAPVLIYSFRNPKASTSTAYIYVGLDITVKIRAAGYQKIMVESNLTKTSAVVAVI